ncbi:MAG: alkaline shock response membrane anchor protein AmaP [Clostridia bacterium]|nr:alkaline shock response membrane anchor protein AmaP [Clostridia bacterium]
MITQEGDLEMGIFDRALLTLYSFFVGIMSVIVILAALGWTDVVYFLTDALASEEQRIVIIIGSVIFFLISVKLVMAAFHKKGVVNTLIQDTAMGQVRISLEALENLVKRVTFQVRGVREVKPYILVEPNGVKVLIRTVVSPDISIPEITNEIQSGVRDYLSEVAGITVNSVKILVENVSSELKARVE